MPARLTSVYALGLEPPDFHAVVEVWLDGAWHFLDATGLAPPAIPLTAGHRGYSRNRYL